jgi:hypothetical protein
MADDLVTIETYQFLPEAEAARMHLEEEGVTAFLPDAELVNMVWLLGNAVGHIKLQVPRSQADRATVLLRELRARRTKRSPEREDDESSVCLACGRNIPEDESQCPVCGWSYGDEGEPD